MGLQTMLGWGWWHLWLCRPYFISWQVSSAISTPKKRMPRNLWKTKFLTKLRESACVRDSCEAVGIDRTTAYKARERDQAFAAAWDAALEDACDSLESALRKRAINHSDLGAIFLLKAHRPEKFRETGRVEITGANGGPLQIEQAASEFDARLAALMVRVTTKSLPE